MSALQLSDRVGREQARGKLAAVEAERATRSAKFRVGARVVVDIQPRTVRGVVVACETNAVAGTVVTVDLETGERRRLVASRVKPDRARRSS